MIAAKSFKKLKTCLVKRLEPIGFAASGNRLWRKVRDTVVVLGIQKSRHSTKDEILFRINVGISVDALRMTAVGPTELVGVPSPDKCHWRNSLQCLLPASKDAWWSVDNEQAAQRVCDEIVAGLIEFALPKIDDVASSGALLRLWQENRGEGLTEYERRSYLARLLCTLNRADDAKAAIQSLQDNSLGKSWAIAARFDIIELRKQLIEQESP